MLEPSAAFAETTRRNFSCRSCLVGVVVANRRRCSRRKTRTAGAVAHGWKPVVELEAVTVVVDCRPVADFAGVVCRRKVGFVGGS